MLTPQQVLALAPDASAAKAGQGLARASHWLELGQTPHALWGLIRGSGSKPYATAVDLAGPAFKCSCPSRKFPCKHAIALMLVVVSDASAVREAEPPDWVSEWIAKRTRTADRRTERAAKPAKPPLRDPQSSERREARVKAGLEELALWLADLVRSGFADARSRPPSFWAAMAARLVDAQATGLARRVRDLGDLVVSGEGWQERMLHRAARIQLAIDGFSHIERLSPELQADLRAELGFTIRQQELIESAPRVTDRWHVVGRRVDESMDENLKFSRVWLRGEATGRMGLVLSFAAGSQPIDTSLLPGMVVEAELVFFPGSSPLRAVLADRRATELGARLGDGLSPREALRAAALAVSKNPWLERVPLTLRGVRLLELSAEERKSCAAAEGEPRIVLGGPAELTWSLLAVTGGRPATLFGEWNGEVLRVLSVEVDGRLSAIRVGAAGPWLVRVSEQVAA